LPALPPVSGRGGKQAKAFLGGLFNRFKQ